MTEPSLPYPAAEISRRAAEILAARVREAGWSLVDLAECGGRTIPYWSRRLKSRQTPLTLEDLQVICDLLLIDPNSILVEIWPTKTP